MKLAPFITAHLDEILAEWVSFARTLAPSAGSMSVLALQDHAKEILQAIALDIETHQDASEAHDKSQGRGPDSALPSAASVHGTLRQTSDFSLIQLGAEFRALRASVLRLWLPQVEKMDGGTARDMVRFNEAIDQALAESIVTYSAQADQSRELFLAILGHDLRAPLSTMSMSASLLVRPDLDPGQVATIGKRVQRSTSLMTKMVNDLLGFTRTQLGSRMPTQLAQTDVEAVCKGALEDARSSNAATEFTFEARDDLSGDFDPVRLHQLLTNLLVNAAQYGAKDRPVEMQAYREVTDVVVKVTNYGPPIPEKSWTTIFKPLVQLPLDGEEEEDARPRTSLGLGLFVAREIALAHAGSIDVTSGETQGTTFTVRLPIGEQAAA